MYSLRRRSSSSWGKPDGSAFCERFSITKAGNFEGKSIPNLLHTKNLTDARFDPFLPTLQEYRRSRTRLHTDDKGFDGMEFPYDRSAVPAVPVQSGSQISGTPQKGRKVFLRTACAIRIRFM